MNYKFHIYLASTVGATCGLIYLYKDNFLHVKPYDPEGDEKLHGKTVIVTGANSGIGYHITGQLGARGAKIIMACRDMEKCEKARQEIIERTYNRKICCKKLDLASMASIKEFAEDFNKNESRLDILVNNAGIMRCPRKTTIDGFEMQLGVNHLGPFLLTHLLLDKLKSSAPSRIVNLADISHKKGKINFQDLNSDKEYDPGKAYDQSKLANVLFTKELAKRLEGTGVTVNAVYPGICQTEIGRHMTVNNSSFSQFVLKPLFSLLVRSAQEGASTPTYCAISTAVDNVSGKFFYDFKEREVLGEATDENISRRLWLTSEKWTKIK